MPACEIEAGGLQQAVAFAGGDAFKSRPEPRGAAITHFDEYQDIVFCQYEVDLATTAAEVPRQQLQPPAAQERFSLPLRPFARQRG